MSSSETRHCLDDALLDDGLHSGTLTVCELENGHRKFVDVSINRNHGDFPVRSLLVGGVSWKIWKSMERLSHISWKIKNDWHHQPDCKRLPEITRRHLSQGRTLPWHNFSLGHLKTPSSHVNTQDIQKKRGLYVNPPWKIWKMLCNSVSPTCHHSWL